MNAKPEIAFLVYEPLKQRRKNNSFDGNTNIGANVIIEVLAKAGIEVGFCTAKNAVNYRIVLVSFTSEYDFYAFYQEVYGLSSWANRSFKVVAGGFGMQNPVLLRNYIDLAVFGRAEHIIVNLITTLLDGKVFEHESVMNLPDITKVKIAQTSKLYSSSYFDEKFIGCINKCLFCHFAWSRKALGDTAHYNQTLLSTSSPEVLINDIPSAITKKEGKVLTAIDGPSERLRFVLSKKIKNDSIVKAINHIGSFGPSKVMIKCYNVGGFPSEEKSDLEELIATLNQCNPKFGIVFILHTTPLRPSLVTPIQYAKINIGSDLYPPASRKGANRILADVNGLVARQGQFIESELSQLKTVLVLRATTDSDKLFKVLCLSKKLKTVTSARAIRLIQNNFDLSQYTRGYNLENHPVQFLESFTPNKTLYAIYKRAMMKLNIDISRD